MPRRRRVLSIALLVLLGAGGGYWLAYGRGPSYVLRTVTVGFMPNQVVVDTAIGSVFVVNSQDQSVSVLNAGSGTVQQTTSIGDASAGLVVDVPTQSVLVMSENSPTVFLFDAANWKGVGNLQANGDTNAAVDPRTGRLFLTTASVLGGASTLAMLDGGTGAMLHSTALAGAIPMGVALDARTDRVFVVNAGDNTAGMVQAGSGRLLRTVTVGSVPVSVAVDTRTGRVFIPNAGANTVSVLDARSGAVLRTVPVAPLPAAAVVDERTDRVFLVHGRVLTAQGRNGQVKTRPRDARAGPVGVTILDARTGAVLRTLTVGGDFGDGSPHHPAGAVMAVDARRGRVFVINRSDPRRTGDGSVSVLDSRSGALLHTIEVGRHPISLAVDEGTARLFVVNTNAGCVDRSGLWNAVLAHLHPVLPWLPAPPAPGCHQPGTVSVIDTAHL